MSDLQTVVETTTGKNCKMIEYLNYCIRYWPYRCDAISIDDYLSGKAINSGTEIEKSADRFASYFLMPETSLIGLAERYVRNRPGQQLTLNDVIRIEQYFGVSHQAAVYRLMDTPYLKSSTGNDFLNVSVRQKAEALGYNADLYRKLPENRQYMTYGHYIDQAARIISEDLVSYGKYEELLLDAFRSDLVYGGEEEGDIID